MALTMGLGLRPVRGDGGTAPVGGGAIAVAAPPRDRMIYDAGAALSAGLGLDPSLDRARVPVWGTASPGTVIDVDVIDARGASVSRTTGAATADAQGAWSASVDLARLPGWQRIRARAQGGDWTAPAPDHRIAAGHVVALWQQSEDHHAVLWTHDQTAAPAIPDPEAVQFFLDRDRDGDPRRVFARDVAPGEDKRAVGLTAGMAAWAAEWIAHAPGEKVAYAYHVQGGTSWAELLDDDDPGRSWATDRALHDLLTADGATPVGLAMGGWYASPRARGSSPAGYTGSLLPSFFGVDADGDPAAAAGYEHDFRELYGDYARTRWMLQEPHRFESPDANVEACRRTVRAGPALAGAAGRVLPPGFAPVDYLNGEDDGAGGWTDTTHPAADTPDGIQRLQRYRALEAARALGRVAAAPPAFDDAYWDPAGAWIEVWSSAGPVTTHRLARGLPALDPATHPHWTEVAGWTYAGGTPVERAEIVAGRVRLYPPAGETFGPAALPPVYGGGGAAHANGTSEADMRAGLWLNVPVVDLGLPGGLGPVAVLPLPDPAVMANPNARVMFARTAAGPNFDQSRAPAPAGSIGPGRTAMTARFAIRVPDVAAAKVSNVDLLALTGTNMRLRVDLRPTRRSANFFVKNAQGAVLGSIDSAKGVFPYGQIVEGLISVRFDTASEDGHLHLELGGVVVGSLTIPAGTVGGALDGSRRLTWLTKAIPLEFGALEVWWASDGPGAVPAGAPDVHVGPGLADVNAHAWKGGADATPA